jgi:hypothetical protein
MLASSLPEQTVADIRIDIQKHVDADKRKHTHGENDQRDLGVVSNGMKRFVGNRGNELFRGSRVTFRAGFYLIRTRNR